MVRVGIEGSGNFDRAVAVHMVLCWQIDRDVVEVPTLMTSRERRGQLGNRHARIASPITSGHRQRPFKPAPACNETAGQSAGRVSTSNVLLSRMTADAGTMAT